MGKLVRDKLKERIKKTYPTSQFTELDSNELKKELKLKLIEETKEFLEATSLEEEKEELSDVLEVIDSFIQLGYFDKVEIQTIQRKKAHNKGSFTKGIYWEKSE